MQMGQQTQSFDELTLDFENNLKFEESEPKLEEEEAGEEKTHQNREKEEEEEEPVVDNDDEDEDEDEDKEFTFACTNPDGSPISPSSAFCNGQIRPVFHFFDTSLLLPSTSSSSSSSSLKKLFSGSGVEAVEEVTVSSPSTEACKKSNSTGHSRVWKFRDLMSLNRSSSDGKDAFVFLKNDERERGKNEYVTKKKEEEKEKKKSSKSKTASSAHEKLYVRNRERKEEEKRRSYLPYRRGLVGLGFFTNINHGLSRNMHPY